MMDTFEAGRTSLVDSIKISTGLLAVSSMDLRTSCDAENIASPSSVQSQLSMNSWPSRYMRPGPTEAKLKLCLPVVLGSRMDLTLNENAGRSSIGAESHNHKSVLTLC